MTKKRFAKSIINKALLNGVQTQENKRDRHLLYFFSLKRFTIVRIRIFIVIFKCIKHVPFFTRIMYKVMHCMK